MNVEEIIKLVQSQPPQNIAAAVVCVLITLLILLRSMRRPCGVKSFTDRSNFDYDVIIVGASITGPCAAKLLSEQGRKVLVIERDMARPDRMVGELLQPGGFEYLERWGIAHTATKVGMPCHGYATKHDGRWVKLPYEKGLTGYSFHFGDFVQNLRAEMQKCKNVTYVNGTVNNVTYDALNKKVVTGVKYTKKGGSDDGKEVSVSGKLVLLCDGGLSKFRQSLAQFKQPKPYSFFVGVIAKGVTMPHEKYGHVFLGKYGPILSYRLDPNEVRLLIDYNGPKLPDDMDDWLTNTILPELPDGYHDGFKKAIKEKDGVHALPTAYYKPIYATHYGALGIGDFNNQRHPLTGGGMTCCFGDCQRLAELLAPIKDLSDVNELACRCVEYSRSRYGHSSCINILSWALYEVFRGPRAMRNACFAYFELGGENVRGPMAMLAGVNKNVGFLLHHYVRVMLYGVFLIIWQGKLSRAIFFFVNPLRWIESVWLLVYSIYVFLPIAWLDLMTMYRFVSPM